MRRLLGVGVICVCAAVRTAAQAAPEYIDAVSSIGGRTRTFDGKAAVTISVVLDPRYESEKEKRAVRVVEVTHDGIGMNADLFTVALTRDAGGSRLTLNRGSGAGNELLPGTYTIRVGVPRLLKTRPDGSLPSDYATRPDQMIDLTLTRPRAAAPKSAVVMPSPLKIERIIDWCGQVSYEPKDWMMRETTREAPIRPNPTVTDAHLVSQTTSGLGKVRVTFPEVIEAAQEKPAEVALVGGSKYWIGNASATVLLQSDSLAKPLMTYSVEVRSRYSYFWLFVTIAVGVGLSILVNRHLIPKIVEMKARGNAAAELERIRTIRATLVDVAFLAKLDPIVETLEKAITDKTLTSDQVTAATTKATGDTNVVVTALTTLVTTLTQELSAVTEAVRAPGAQTGNLRELATGTEKEAERLHTDLRLGHITSTERDLGHLKRNLPSQTRWAVTAWKHVVAQSIKTIGRWPGLAVDKTLGAIENDLGQLDESAVRTLEDVKKTLSLTEDISRMLLTSLGPHGFEEIHDLVRDTISEITRVHPNSPELPALRAAEEKLGAFDEATLPQELAAAAKAVDAARPALEKAMEAAWKHLGAPAPIPGLAEGDFTKALDAIQKQLPAPQPKAAAPGMPGGMGATATTRRMPKTPPPPAPQPMQFSRHALRAESVQPPEYYTNIADAASDLRDFILAGFVVGSGMLIFMPTYIGTFPDFFGALLWGFSVNLGAETVTSYAAPLLARRPFLK